MAKDFKKEIAHYLESATTANKDRFALGLEYLKLRYGVANNLGLSHRQIFKTQNQFKSHERVRQIIKEALMILKTKDLRTKQTPFNEMYEFFIAKKGDRVRIRLEEIVKEQALSGFINNTKGLIHFLKDSEVDHEWEGQFCYLYPKSNSRQLLRESAQRNLKKNRSDSKSKHREKYITINTLTHKLTDKHCKDLTHDTNEFYKAFAKKNIVFDRTELSHSYTSLVDLKLFNFIVEKQTHERIKQFAKSKKVPLKYLYAEIAFRANLTEPKKPI